MSDKHEIASLIEGLCFIGLLTINSITEARLDRCKLDLVRAETLLEMRGSNEQKTKN